MIWLMIVSILLVVSYVGITIWKRRELPESVSAMVYNLPKPWQWLWIVWLWASTYTLTPALFEVMPEDWGVIAHAFATSMLFIGAMPLMKDSENRAHYALAIAAGIFSQLCVLIIDAQWLATWLVFPFLMASVYVQPQGGIAKAVNGKGVFVAEVVCYIALEGSLIFKM